eukprot:g4231.t1
MIGCFLEEAEKHFGRSKKSKFQFLESEIVGRTTTCDGPFGKRRMVYCDHATCSQPLRFIEQYIYKRVLPYYVNDEAGDTFCGKHMTHWMVDSRKTVREFVNANDSYAVLFLGTGGRTNAIHRLFHIINAQTRHDLCIVLGPYEHDSTFLAAITTSKHVIRVKLASDGTPEINHLKSILDYCIQQGMQPIGVFSTVSSVTGVITESDEVTALIHEFGGLCFWDCTASAPYGPIEVINEKRPHCSKDAVFFAPHKLTGCFSTPGILIAKQNLFTNKIPGVPGEKSAAFVTHTSYIFKRVIEEREQADSCDTIGIIRTALVLALRPILSQYEIEAASYRISTRVKQALSETQNLQLLGNRDLKSMPIFSFVIGYGLRLALHHQFVSVLLNDLFGIQSRSGCLSAGPYSQTLLRISEHQAEQFFPFIESNSVKEEGQIIEEIMIPGFTRISLMYTMKDKDVEFVISALQFVARNGWKFLPAYKYEAKSGCWNFDSETIAYKWKSNSISHNNKWFRNSRQLKCITYAAELSSGMNQSWFHEKRIQGNEGLTQNAADKRWFLLPSEAYRDL